MAGVISHQRNDTGHIGTNNSAACYVETPRLGASGVKMTPENLIEIDFQRGNFFFNCPIKSFLNYFGDQYDWTAGGPSDGNEWKKYCIVPRAYPSRTLLLCLL